jgi:hypothetical protein
MAKPSNETASSKMAAPLAAMEGIREFVFPGSARRIAIHRRCVAFVAEGKQSGRTVIGFYTQANPCPVDAAYEDVYAWWRKKAKPQRHGNGSSAAPTKADTDQYGHSPSRTGKPKTLPQNAIAKKPVIEAKRRFPGTLTLPGKAQTVPQAEKMR